MRYSSVYLQVIVSQTVFIVDPFWLREITADTHILANINIESPDDRCTKLIVCVSEQILHAAVEHVMVHYSIWL